MSKATNFNKRNGNVNLFFENLSLVNSREMFGPDSIWNYADETCLISNSTKICKSFRIRNNVTGRTCHICGNKYEC